MNDSTARSFASTHAEPRQEAPSEVNTEYLGRLRAALGAVTGALDCLLGDVLADVASPNAHGMAVENPDHPYHASVAGARAALGLARPLGDNTSLDSLDNDAAVDVLPHFLVIGGNAFWVEPFGTAGGRCLMSTGLDAETGAVCWDEGYEVIEAECLGGADGYAAVVAALAATEVR